jgi:hypothetical protein
VYTANNTQSLHRIVVQQAAHMNHTARLLTALAPVTNGRASHGMGQSNFTAQHATARAQSSTAHKQTVGQVINPAPVDTQNPVHSHTCRQRLHSDANKHTLSEAHMLANTHNSSNHSFTGNVKVWGSSVQGTTRSALMHALLNLLTPTLQCWFACAD